MKNLALVTMLTTLAACGGSSGSKNKPSLEAYRSNLTQERGEVTISKHDGESVDISAIEGKVSLKRKADVFTSREVVLRVQGNEIYTLREEIRNGKVENRQVELDTSDPVKELQNLIDKGQAQIIGNTIQINVTSTDQSEYLGSTLDYNFVVNGTTTLERPNCNFITEIIQTVTLNTNGVQTSMNDVKSSIKNSCEKALSSKELKAIDLSSVEFCEGEEEVRCETKNMQFLVNDL